MSDSKTHTSYKKDANWEVGLRPYFKYRDLGMKDKTGGKVHAHVIRANEPCKGGTGYHSHQLDFHMNYCLRGWIRMEFEDIGQVRFQAGDCWYQPPDIKHEVLEYSDDFENLEITMPADFGTRDEERV